MGTIADELRELADKLDVSWEENRYKVMVRLLMLVKGMMK